MRKKVLGFTLIELMIVVSIIGILASIAIPAYQMYTIRAQVVEAFSLASELKGSVQEFRKERGRMPATNSEAGVPEPKFLIGNYVTRVEVHDGALDIEFGNNANTNLTGKILTLQPLIVTGESCEPHVLALWTAVDPEGDGGRGRKPDHRGPEIRAGIVSGGLRRSDGELSSVQGGIQMFDMKPKVSVLVSLAFPLVLAWASAARSQSPATEAPSPRPDMALVYVYRVGIGEEVKVGSVHISVDGKGVFGVKNYGYSWFYISAGPHEFKAEWSFMEKPRMEDGHFGPSIVTLETEPGKTYYINYLVNQSEASKGAKGFWASSGLIGKASSKSHVISDGLVVEGEALGALNVGKCRFQQNHFSAQ